MVDPHHCMGSSYAFDLMHELKLEHLNLQIQRLQRQSFLDETTFCLRRLALKYITHRLLDKLLLLLHDEYISAMKTVLRRMQSHSLSECLPKLSFYLPLLSINKIIS